METAWRDFGYMDQCEILTLVTRLRNCTCTHAANYWGDNVIKPATHTWIFVQHLVNGIPRLQSPERKVLSGPRQLFRSSLLRTRTRGIYNSNESGAAPNSSMTHLNKNTTWGRKWLLRSPSRLIHAVYALAIFKWPNC